MKIAKQKKKEWLQQLNNLIDREISAHKAKLKIRMIKKKEGEKIDYYIYNYIN